MTYGASPVKRSRRTKVALAELDQVIIDVIEADYPVTLRGVYYRVVSAGAIEKTENGYRTVGRRLLDLRRTGQVPYDRITDGQRWVIHPRRYDSVEDALETTARMYRRALWTDAPVEIHLFSEKDALSGVIAPIAEQWDVPLGVVRGYCSESFAWQMGEAIAAAGKPVYVYQLGDHDPSGIGAWEDFQTKIRGFAPDAEVTFERLAVTEQQIEELHLPTRPTKTSDTRARSFTGGSVEVDAIPAATLRQIVSRAIVQHIDIGQLGVIEMAEEEERAGLLALAGREGGWTP